MRGDIELMGVPPLGKNLPLYSSFESVENIVFSFDTNYG